MSTVVKIKNITCTGIVCTLHPLASIVSVHGYDHWANCIIIINIKGMEHDPNIFISFDKYLFLEVINILI